MKRTLWLLKIVATVSKVTSFLISSLHTLRPFHSISEFNSRIHWGRLVSACHSKFHVYLLT